MSKTLKEFLNQPAVLHVPTAEEVELTAILNAQPEGGLAREAVVTLPDDTFTRE